MSTQPNYINENFKNLNLPNDTVYAIIFEPKPKFPLAKLKLDIASYKKFNPVLPSTSGYEGYINKEEGLAVITINGNVIRADYFPDLEKQKLCPNCYDGLGGIRIIRD